MVRQQQQQQQTSWRLLQSQQQLWWLMLCCRGAVGHLGLATQRQHCSSYSLLLRQLHKLQLLLLLLLLLLQQTSHWLLQSQPQLQRLMLSRMGAVEHVERLALMQPSSSRDRLKQLTSSSRDRLKLL
jgi:hypothetical protein